MLTLASVEQQIVRFKQQFLQLEQGDIQDLLDTNQLFQMINLGVLPGTPEAG